MTSGEQPLISVIIPCYNYASFLTDALNSVLAQTYSNWECIVIDDGSKDNTAIVTKSFVDKDERFRYVYQQNQGISAARNAGLEISTGTYIQFLDADDMLPPQKFELQLGVFSKMHDADIVYGDALFFHNDNPTVFFTDRDGRESKTRHLKASGRGAEMVRRLCINNFIDTAAPLVKRSLIKKIGPFVAAYPIYQDWHYWFRCAAAGALFIYQPGEGMNYYYRFGHTSAMSNKKQMVNDGIRIRRFMVRYLPFTLKLYNSYRLFKLLVKKILPV